MSLPGINSAYVIDREYPPARLFNSMQDPQPELWLFRVFTEVAATRSMTAAATRLGLTQSAVSQAVRRLERAMGVELVERGRRPLSLTRPGTLLQERVGTILRDAARLPHDLQSAAQLPTQEVRLGLVDSFASTAGPGLILALSGEATRVVVWSGLTPSLGASLTAREVDMVVTSDELDDADGLHRWALWREPFVLLVPRGAPSLVKRMSLARLAAELPIIRYSARSHTGVLIERHLRRIGLVTQRRIEVDGSDALIAMVAAGLGWALATPLCLLQGSAHARRVHALPLPGPGFSRTLSLICRSDGPAAFAARAARAAGGVLRRDCLAKLQSLAPAATVDIIVPEHTLPL